MTERVNTNTDFAEKSIYLAMKENEEWKMTPGKKKRKITKKSPTSCSPHRRASGFPKSVIGGYLLGLRFYNPKSMYFNAEIELR